MNFLNHPVSTKTPCVIATGFSTAYLGDERILREFILGDGLREEITGKGTNAILYLINDSYDPLNYRQLRIGLNKDARLISRFEPYCGRPIAEIPDPYGCHESYAQHFAQALLARLRSLNIHPVILDTYQAYRNDHYADFIARTFADYYRIQEMLADEFDGYGIQNLFHAQCPKCLCIDATHIRDVRDDIVQFECERCDTVTRQPVNELQGKLSWKLDCAARWNLYGIDVETFSKAHLTRLGSFAISRFISQHFYGAQVPTPVRYGAVSINREMSCRLVEVLPPEMLKTLFMTHIARDMDITRESIENFAHRFMVRPGLSYVDYVRNELPRQAIREENEEKAFEVSGTEPPAQFITDDALVAYGNRFSRFYYDKEHGLHFPDIKVIAAADPAMAKIARDIILYALSVRNELQSEKDNIVSLISSYLRDRKTTSSHVYRYMRQIFGQTQGPKLGTLLALLPRDYLSLIQNILDYYISAQISSEDSSRKLKNDSEYKIVDIRTRWNADRRCGNP